ncbi:epsin-1 isoform X2 [Narcine bancroftii]|uniref:epsin-1 isoform X2 n=1 Tax=Narcine bancroftii TaxID=1343680 RepID=UPI00383194B8
MSTSSLRRQMKNIVHNYSEAEIKVREATSNDPWGPSGSLMSEISDLTYNVAAFAEIMGMVWRRLNDHGKNWRHVYKALTLAEYLVKSGSERVAHQCRENIYAVQTLKDFQYIDRDGKDQGVNVREKAKQLVALLKDEEKLREERAHALKTKEKMAQVATASTAPSAPSSLRGPADIDQAWPQSSGEEELQLQLALAMSKEEATQEERLRRGDDLRLQMAIEESQKQNMHGTEKEKSSLVDLAKVFSGPAVTTDPWTGVAVAPGPPVSLTSDPWGSPATADPWGPLPQVVNPAQESWDPLGPRSLSPSEPWAPVPVPGPPAGPDPWAPVAVPGGNTTTLPALHGPWEPSPSSETGAKATGTMTSDPFVDPANLDDFSEFDSLRPSQLSVELAVADTLHSPDIPPPRLGAGSPDLFDLSGVGSALPVAPTPQEPPVTRKTPESFLGPNAALVDLGALVPSVPRTTNPFHAAGSPSSTNPFGRSTPPPPTLNQLRASPVPLAPSGSHPRSVSPLPPALSPLVAPVLPLSSHNGFPHQPPPPSTTTTNPFLL